MEPSSSQPVVVNHDESLNSGAVNAVDETERQEDPDWKFKGDDAAQSPSKRSSKSSVTVTYAPPGDDSTYVTEMPSKSTVRYSNEIDRVTISLNESIEDAYITDKTYVISSQGRRHGTRKRGVLTVLCCVTIPRNKQSFD